jgi:hypothetical protein
MTQLRPVTALVDDGWPDRTDTLIGWASFYHAKMSAQILYHIVDLQEDGREDSAVRLALYIRGRSSPSIGIPSRLICLGDNITDGIIFPIRAGVIGRDAVQVRNGRDQT